MRSFSTTQRSLVFVVASFVTALVGAYLVQRNLPAGPPPTQLCLHLDSTRPLDPGAVERRLHDPDRISSACQAAGVSPDDPLVQQMLLSLRVQAAPRDGDSIDVLATVDRDLDPLAAAAVLEQLGQSPTAPPSNASASPNDALHRAEANTNYLRQKWADARSRVRAVLAESAQATAAPTLSLPTEPALPSAVASVVSAAERRIAQLERQRSELLQRLTPAHPEVVALDHQIELARGMLPTSSAAPTPRSASGPAIGRTPSNVRTLDLAALAKAEAQADAAAAELLAALDHERAVRASMTPGAMAPSADRATVVVELPGATPARTLWLAAVGVLAFLVGLNAMNLLPRATATYGNVRQIERHLGIPVLAVLPREGADG